MKEGDDFFSFFIFLSLSKHWRSGDCKLSGWATLPAMVENGR